MENKEKFYITTAIAYTSGKPHIGNTYEIILSDVIARSKRMQGYDVFFMTGTDEHGEKIEMKAKEKGLTPKAFVDNIAGDIKHLWDFMNISYDKFIRTTDEDHEKCVQKIFKKFYDQGDIYKGSYKGYKEIMNLVVYDEEQKFDEKGEPLLDEFGNIVVDVTENSDATYDLRQEEIAKAVILYPSVSIVEDMAAVADIISTECMIKSGFGKEPKTEEC
jgi:leucyl-tRNA synthetase